MGMVRRMATTSKPKRSASEFEVQKQSFQHSVTGMVDTHNIPDKLVIKSWFQHPTSNYTAHDKGAKRVEVHGMSDNRQITATFAVAMSGDYLPMQLHVLYEGKTERSHPKFKLPESFVVWHSPNHWSNAELTVRFVEKVIIPYIKKVREEINTPDQYAVVILDAFSGHNSDALNEIVGKKKKSFGRKGS